eukprot:8578714-Pyramimonas_sp.AAC.1
MARQTVSEQSYSRQQRRPLGTHRGRAQPPRRSGTITHSSPPHQHPPHLGGITSTRVSPPRVVRQQP